jgi:ribosomal protein L16 Arg81 hydroxylase
MINSACIPPVWLKWIAENQTRGVAPAEILDILVANGFDPVVAREQVSRPPGHPSLPTEGMPARDTEKLQELMSIYSDLWRHRNIKHIDRVIGLTGEQFFRLYYAANRPVILLDSMQDWPALQSWSPDYLRARCGEQLVEVMTGRNSDAQYEINSERHKTRMRLDQFVELVQNAGATNDFYMVANNRSLESDSMRLLLDDIHTLDELLDPQKASGRLFLWFGPAGSVTPLHHDTMNVLLAQVLGRKLITLIPSFETHLVYNHIGVYSAVDCEAPDYDRYPLFRDASRVEVLLEPGEALFIPVGWWHHVRSLDVSISVSFTNFLAPNEYACEIGGYGS